jgi:ribosome-dependent ATPase
VPISGSAHASLSDPTSDVVLVEEVEHRYKATVALSSVSLALSHGSTMAVIGPDGVGKSTLLALIAGAKVIQAGHVRVLGGDMAEARHRTNVSPRIAFMPQGLGKNLYPSLTVAENLDFFARLYGSSQVARQARIEALLIATGLDPFPDRPAGKLSGGMRQKLSLCCALVHDPDLLVLDEPTTGIDPLSRRQFWALIDGIRARRPQLSLLVSTAYMEEAERFDMLVAMDQGRILAVGAIADVKAHVEAATVEEAYVRLRHPERERIATPFVVRPRQTLASDPVITADGLTCRFGDFTAVDDVSFRIERGEIFGFLGSNGCGKTTTMKMLTGLLPASSGRATLLGAPIDATDVATRMRVGVMTQSFSLYSELTVQANLELHARLYRVPGSELRERVEDTLQKFGLSVVRHSYPGAISLGMRQRLQLAVACLHKPEVLILDEPTSGVDPEARDHFWKMLIALSRDDGVTVFVSTHFMNEAERCDRVSLMHAGKLLAAGAPAALAADKGVATLEDAFVAHLTAASGSATMPEWKSAAASGNADTLTGLAAWISWVVAFARREAIELFRDRVRVAFALLAPLVLMMTFSKGISFDIEQLPFAVFDRDQSAESQSLVLHLEGSRYFAARRSVLSDTEIDQRLQSGEAALVVGVPPAFGRDLLRGRVPEISLWLDGANPSRATTARGYAESIINSFVEQAIRRETGAAPAVMVSVQPRFWYNQDFRSVFAIAPGVIMIIAMLITAMITALGVVREREIGSIINLSVSPATSSSFLVGKAIPYVAIASLTFVIMVVLAITVLGLSVRGSIAALMLGGFLYVTAASTFGLLVSTFVRSQVAAMFACALLTILPAMNFSGFMQPISNLSPTGRAIGYAFPSYWFQEISIGVFAKGLGFFDLTPALLALGIFPFLCTLAASRLLRKQER